MRNFDMDKIKRKQLDAALSRRATPGKEGAAAVLSRRERRDLDQAQGLVPFAVKLDSDLVKRIQALAQERKSGLTELVTELLNKGLDARQA